MSSELSVPAGLADKVQQRLRDTIADLIPDDQWKKMVAESISRFMRPRMAGEGYSRREIASGMDDVVHRALERHCAEKIEDTLRMGVVVSFEGKEMPFGDVVVRLIDKNAGPILGHLLGQALGKQLEHVSANVAEEVRRKIANNY